MTEQTIPEGMKPWSGGKGPPDDYDPSKPVWFEATPYQPAELYTPENSPLNPKAWFAAGKAGSYRRVLAYTPKPEQPRITPEVVERIREMAETALECGQTLDPREILAQIEPPAHPWPLGTRVTKVKGSNWTGRIVGTYSTDLTPEGYAVESETEAGSVQIYPRAALAIVEASHEQALSNVEGGE